VRHVPAAAFWRAWSVWAVTVAATAAALGYDAFHPLPASLASEGGSPANRVVAAGLVLLATHVVGLRTPVAVAAATLAAAALFSPVRRRVQRVVDRRFNRARYDADKTVAAFAARLKDAMDLDAVRDDLTGAVQRALEPAHVSVWISQRG
jgi:hypothetical protein